MLTITIPSNRHKKPSCLQYKPQKENATNTTAQTPYQTHPKRQTSPPNQMTLSTHLPTTPFPKNRSSSCTNLALSTTLLAP